MVQENRILHLDLMLPVRHQFNLNVRDYQEGGPDSSIESSLSQKVAKTINS
jgi:hypothetical protein